MDRMNYPPTNFVPAKRCLWSVCLVGLLLLGGCASSSSTLSSVEHSPAIQVAVVDTVGLRASSSLEVADLQYSPEIIVGEAEKVILHREFERAVTEELTQFTKTPHGKVGDVKLIVTVTRLVQREGSAIGAETPAAFGVSARLTREGQPAVWEGSYYFGDFALTQNLLRTGEKASANEGSVAYMSASQLSRAGFRGLLSRLNHDRIESFQSK